MNSNQLLEKNSLYCALVVFIVSLVIFFSESNEFWKSAMAALLTAGLAWLTYVVVRLVILTIRK